MHEPALNSVHDLRAHRSGGEANAGNNETNQATHHGPLVADGTDDDQEQADEEANHRDDANAPGDDRNEFAALAPKASSKELPELLLGVWSEPG